MQHSRRFPPRAIFLLILGVAVPSMALQCGDVGIGPTEIQGCSNTYDSDFPTNGTLSINKPARCPFHITSFVTQFPYAATITLPTGSGVLYNQFQSEVFDRLGNTTQSNISAVWSQRDAWYINASGEYLAGQAGFDSYDNGFDRVLNQFKSLYTNNWTSATATLGYSFGPPDATVIGPSTGLPSGTSYELNASTSDPAAVSPLTWDWYVDGVHVGSTSTGTFDWNTGDPGSTQDITVIMTDVNGIQHSAYTTATACSGTEISC